MFSDRGKILTALVVISALRVETYLVNFQNGISKMSYRPVNNRTSRFLFDELFGIDVTGGDESADIDDEQKLRNCSCECGVFNQENRIVGGRPAEPHRYPWVARLVYDGRFHCGASLVTNDYVITAAHCLRRLKRSKIRVILGDHDQYVTTDGAAIMRAVSAIIRHRNFDMNSYNHDVALLKLRKPVKFTKTVKPICLPGHGIAKALSDINVSTGIQYTLVSSWKERQGGEERAVCERWFLRRDQSLICSDPAGKEGTVVGWGRTTEGGMLPGVVHEVKVPILSLQQCRQMKYRANRITNNMICAGHGTRDSCQGDSGGPLLVQEGDKLELAGIVSWGVGCGRPGYPGVYTRVTRYLNWIKSNMNDTCYCVK